MIFENCFDEAGHRIPYAALIADAIASLGCQVDVCFPNAVEGSSSIIEFFDAGLLKKVNLRFFDAKRGKSARHKAKQISKDFHALISELNPGHVIVPTGDLLAFAVGLRLFSLSNMSSKNVPIDILLMKSDFVHQHVNPWKRKLRRAKWLVSGMKNWHRIAVLDPILWQHERTKRKGLELCPDPVPPKPETGKNDARQTLGLPSDSRLMVSVGMQNETKGIDLLIESFVRNKDGSPNNYLFLAGPMSEGVRACLNRNKNEKLIVLDRFMSESEFQNALLAADVVAVPYRTTERPSGIICRCLSWGIPILGTNHGWPAWACRQFESGRTVDILDPSKFSKAITLALDDSDQFVQSDAARVYSEFNTVANFKEFWKRGVDLENSQFRPLDLKT
jgi:glycosyltransferase involved in cell wall biosynthesis